MSRDFFDVARHQRAHRDFAAMPVPDEVIAKLLTHATYAPSAENSQPWEFIVIKDAAARAELSAIAKRAWEGGAREYERGRLSESVFADVDHGMVSGFATAPVWVLVAGDTDRVMESALDESVYPAVQNLLLGATALGLGSALTTIVKVFASELRELCQMPDTLVPLAAIPLGYPARQLGLSRREPATEHTHSNRFGTPWP
ncbi:MAG: nitroreductase family protein [Acidobacteria bacterium]|nr:nitroreductase family protein [Acidobacteriota bacterium]